VRLSANRKNDRIAQRLLAKTWQVPSIFSEALHFVYICKTCIKKAVVNNKTISTSSPNTQQTNNITVRQSQSCVTVPLRTVIGFSAKNVHSLIKADTSTPLHPHMAD
jgi:hypothetical protein